MEKKFKLLLPNPQNYIRVLVGSVQTTISISELNQEEIENYAETVKQAFLKHWKSKTKSHE